MIKCSVAAAAFCLSLKRQEGGRERERDKEGHRERPHVSERVRTGVRWVGWGGVGWVG